MLCINCCSIEANWDSVQELFCNLSSGGLKLDMIALTEIFRIRDSQQYNINGYLILLFNTRLQNDDGHIYINESFTYTKREDLSIFIPRLFESKFQKTVQNNKNKHILVGVVYRPIQLLVQI